MKLSFSKIPITKATIFSSFSKYFFILNKSSFKHIPPNTILEKNPWVITNRFKSFIKYETRFLSKVFQKNNPLCTYTHNGLKSHCRSLHKFIWNFHLFLFRTLVTYMPVKHFKSCFPYLLQILINGCKLQHLRNRLVI